MNILARKIRPSDFTTDIRNSSFAKEIDNLQVYLSPTMISFCVVVAATTIQKLAQRGVLSNRKRKLKGYGIHEKLNFASKRLYLLYRCTPVAVSSNIPGGHS